jgi:hypothetical protein
MSLNTTQLEHIFQSEGVGDSRSENFLVIVRDFESRSVFSGEPTRPVRIDYSPISQHINQLTEGRAFFPGVTIRRSESPEEKFRRLRDEWLADIQYSSSGTEITSHPAYQSIIDMGSEALPLIIHELRRQLGHWFWALFKITGENPVPPENLGNLEKMREAWLQWADTQSFGETEQDDG